MSLVNDMLRDLDRRKQLPVQARRISGMLHTYDETRRTHPLLVLLLVLLCLLVGVGSGYFLFSKTRSAELQDIVVATEVLAPAPAAAAPVEVVPAGASLEIMEEEVSENGFSLRVNANQKFVYSISNRSSNGMTLQLDGIDSYALSAPTVGGVSVIQLPGHTLLEVELNDDADFQVYEDVSTARFDLVVAANYRVPQVGGPLEASGSFTQTTMPTAAKFPSVILETAAAPDVQNNHPVAEPSVAAPAVQEAAVTTRSQSNAGTPRETPVRVNRGLTFEQQDRETSQLSINLIQTGRLIEAYEKLLTFITRNPEAHFSRETLATILLAQQETAQARIIVDEGLALAPNYSPYKKIKARLLMQEGASVEALELMRAVPPVLASDTEYHELLATLYQQNNMHGLAISSYQELLRTNSEQGRWWAGLAISLEVQGKKDDAIASYQAAMQAKNLDANLRQYAQNRISTLSVQ